MKHPLFILLSVVFAASYANAADSLLYFEAQGIAGYSSADSGAVYHSGHKYDAMQKNGIGFDYIKKFSGEYGDIGTGALQMRLVWDDADDKPQLQIYNAYFKVKTSAADIWAGHNRIAFGLASYWDTHADLLQPLSMYGFGADRDWGAGVSRDFADGDFAAALTAGSGMPLKTEGNWLATSRVSYGVLPRDNYNIGLSFMGGRMLDTMGYKVLDRDPKNVFLGGVDAAYNYGRMEHKAEFDFGRKNDMPAIGAFYRIAFNFLEEDRFKLEGQYIYTKQEGTSEAIIGAGGKYRITPYLASGVMYQKTREMNDNRIVFQFYYYIRV
ncbi:MAG: hypothetical protein LBL61_05985 [Elusimicrobiota bacterium]|jgi:hypothetical protein|nr:hypothetical protein [Elusimicrobiota bacterium]